MITQRFKNKPAILIATGPSLNEEVVEVIRKYKDDFVIFGCNDSYKIVDFLDIHYACDLKWWDYHAREVKELRPDLECWTGSETAAKKYGLTYIEGKYVSRLSIDPSIIHWGSNSGYQQLNIAFLMGCSKFILVGYNMKKDSKGKSHFFGDHPKKIRSNSPYPTFVASFNTIQKEIKPYIVNCTPDSALTMFRQNDLEEELKCG